MNSAPLLSNSQQQMMQNMQQTGHFPNSNTNIINNAQQASQFVASSQVNSAPQTSNTYTGPVNSYISSQNAPQQISSNAPGSLFSNVGQVYIPQQIPIQAQIPLNYGLGHNNLQVPLNINRLGHNAHGYPEPNQVYNYDEPLVQKVK